MKRIVVVIMTAVLCASLVACSAAKPSQSESASDASAESAAKKAGVCWYNFADTFISNARQTLDNVSKADGTVLVSNADSQGDVATQMNNMDNFYTQGVDFLVVNNINYNAISELVAKAKEKNTTMIFANTTSPSDADFASNQNLWFVSSAAEQSGKIMGDAAVNYWKSRPEADRNKNGKLDYIMLLGQQGNYDTEMRSTKSIDAIKAAGITVNNIGGELICDWQTQKAQDTVQALLANYGKEVDFIFACNDDMALGAINALKAAGLDKDDKSYVPVCGVDATVKGVQAIEDGTMLVTALNNPVDLSKAIYKVMYLLAEGQEVTTETMNRPGVTVDGHRVWLSYKAITKDNVSDATYDVNDTTY